MRTTWQELPPALTATAVLLVVLVLATCGDSQSPTETPSIATPPTAPSPGAPDGGNADDSGSLELASVPLPFAGTVQSTSAGFSITQKGSGQAIVGQSWGTGVAVQASIVNLSNSSPALRASTPVPSGSAILAENNGPAGSGRALVARSTGGTGVALFEAGSSSVWEGVRIRHRGSGNSLVVTQEGTGIADALWVRNDGKGRAGFFEIANSSSFHRALEVQSNGHGAALKVNQTGTGIGAIVATSGSEYAGVFLNSNSTTTREAFSIENYGPGATLLVVHNNDSGNIAEFHRDFGNPVIRFANNGRGFFDGGTQLGGADVAEALAVEGPVTRYEPGDVLVISTRADRRVTKTRERYSTRVAGVYATKPGVLLTERTNAEGLRGLVPVGVLGVIPTKVSAENGPIRRGDLLVTARRPGHAMRATPVVVQGVALYPTGAILGRAMEEFRGPGTGLIRVLVSVK